MIKECNVVKKGRTGGAFGRPEIENCSGRGKIVPALLRLKRKSPFSSKLLAPARSTRTGHKNNFILLAFYTQGLLQ